jgi:peptidyl-prolyl cis-trans isomerase SurA
MKIYFINKEDVLMRKYIGLVVLFWSVCAAAEQLDRVVAVINDGVVTQSEFDAQLVMWHKQMDAKKGPKPSEQVLQKQVLNQLIDEALQLQMAGHHGLTVDNAELDDTIDNIAKNNHLSLSAFREALTREGFTFDEYREHLRKEMLITRVQQQAVGRDVMISSEQVEDYLRTSLASEKAMQVYHVEHLVVPLVDEPTPEQVKKAELKARAVLKKIKPEQELNQVAMAEATAEYALEGGDLGERHLAELPDIFSKRVRSMSVGEVAGPLRTENGFQLLRLVSVSQADKKHTVLKTHVRHILLKQDASHTEHEAKRQSDNLYEQLKSGKSFATLAKQYSSDLASATDGGDLGWVTPEELVPAFSEVMIALPLKTVSRPVKTGFGWHLIEVIERKQIDDSDAYQHQQVRQFLHQRKFGEALQTWQQHVRNTSYIHILDKDLA